MTWTLDVYPQAGVCNVVLNDHVTVVFEDVPLGKVRHSQTITVAGSAVEAGDLKMGDVHIKRKYSYGKTRIEVEDHVIAILNGGRVIVVDGNTIEQRASPFSVVVNTDGSMEYLDSK